MMKNLIASMAVSVLSLLVARGGPMLPPVPATFDLSEIVQVQFFHVVTNKTVTTGSSTNEIVFSSASTATTHFTGSNLLALIENSLNTNFPAGSQIGFQSPFLVVMLDSTGTNNFRLDSVIKTTIDNGTFFVSGTGTRVTNTGPGGVTTSGNMTSTTLASMSFTYDDTALVSSNQTQFQLKGLVVAKGTINLKTKVERQTFEFQCTGGGPVQGVPTILTGTISTKYNGPEGL